MSLLIMWAHPRSRSTALERMMIERGDLFVIHEPFCTIYDTGKFGLEDPWGKRRDFERYDDFIHWLIEVSGRVNVFIKETTEYRYVEVIESGVLFEFAKHAFIIRNPYNSIPSNYEINSALTKEEAGYKYLSELFDIVHEIKQEVPVVIEADELVSCPELIIRKFCEDMGIPFVEEALKWTAQEIKIWERTQKWHVAATQSQGFYKAQRTYRHTVENNEILKACYDFNLPYYEKILAYKNKKSI